MGSAMDCTEERIKKEMRKTRELRVRERKRDKKRLRGKVETIVG